MNSKRNWQLTPKQENNYKNLCRQIDKVFDYRTHHQGKRGTERYRASCYEFAKHLAKEYNSTHFRNIRDKHLESFVKESQKQGVSAATIKTDLASVRKLHNMLPDTRYRLEDSKVANKKFDLEKRVIVGVDRAWAKEEINLAALRANAMGRKDVEWSIRIAESTGTRIEEVTALTRSQLRSALKNGYIGLTTTKGGIPRDIPLNKESEGVFRDILRNPHNSEKIFISHGSTHHQSIKSIQNWIFNNRRYFNLSHTPDQKYLDTMNIQHEQIKLTFHGIRHLYAREQYKKFVGSGLSALQARKEVAILLGHGRDTVTKVYLGGKY